MFPGGICTFIDISGTEVEILNLKAGLLLSRLRFSYYGKSQQSVRGEFYGVVSAVLAEPDTDTPVALGGNFSLDLQGGQSEDIEYISAFRTFYVGTRTGRRNLQTLFCRHRYRSYPR